MPDASTAPAGRPGRLVSLEIGRFIAALLVAVSHEIGVCGVAGRPAFGGFNLPPIPSVLFFFVLSGFVMMTVHHRDFGRPRRVPRYFWRRLCRIYPIYWLSLLLVLLLDLFGQHYPWVFLVKAVTLWPFQTNISDINPPAWTLRFEVAFYIMFGLALLPYVGRFFLAAWIVAVGWSWYPTSLVFGPLTHHLGFGWYGYLPIALRWHFFGTPEMYFFAGLAAGYGFLKWRAPAGIAWAVLAVAVVALVYSVHLADDGLGYPSDIRTPLVALLFGALILSLATLERDGSLKVGAGLAVAGAMSYPLYLFHPVVIGLSSLVFSRWPGLRAIGAPLHLTIMIVLSLMLAALVTFAVDIPVQRWLRAPLRRRRDVAGVGG